ncbi:MAG: HAD hydrolase-like protein [Acidobacteria bacterium]|nr:HAD hydrolase-like protein [Acidobacteriota bacterium]
MKPRPSPPTARRRAQRSRGRSKPAAPPPAISFCIFDLDDTLYDCFGQRVRLAHRHAAAALARAGVPATAEQIFRVRLQAFRKDPLLKAIDREVCQRFGIPFAEELHQIARHAYFGTPVTRLRLFPGVRRMLRTLRRKGVRNFIVSYGEPSVQRDKVRELALDCEPAVAQIFFADTGRLVTKGDLFRSLLRRMGGDSSRFLVVGDRPSSEIRAGKRLGMRTVRMRHGEFARLEPASAEEEADFEITAISALLRLPLRFGNR